MDLPNSSFIPLHVGKAISELDLGIQGDDQGDNISAKNPNYCELTGQYWLWKNVKDVDYVGLCHYRRFFNFSGCGDLFLDYTLKRGEYFEKLKSESPNISKLFKRHDIVLAKPKVFPFSVAVQYGMCHNSLDLNTVEQIILELDPSYRESIEYVFKRNNRLSTYNMFIMKRADFDKYCEWLFAVLGEAERRIDISSYDKVQGRIFGFLSERLLNLYVYHNKMRVNHRPVVFLNDNAVRKNVLQRFHKRLRCALSFFINKGVVMKNSW